MLKKVCLLAITIWIIILPLIVWQGHFEVPKVFWFLSLGIPILICLSLNFFNLIITKKDKWYLLWLLSLLVSSTLGIDFKTSLLGGSYRHQGIIFFLCLWLVMKVVELLNAKEKEILYKGIGITILIEALIVIFGYKLGTLGDINATSGFLAIGIYFIYKYLPKWLTTFPLIAMFIDFSKSGFLSLLPYLFKRINIFLLLILACLSFLYKPINLNSPFENRQVIWTHAINLIKTKPILGYGAESNEFIFDKSFKESGFPLSNLIIDRAHNLILDITIWSGLIGLVFFGLFLKESYVNLDFDRKKIFASFLIFSMFQPLSVAHWILFALIV